MVQRKPPAEPSAVCALKVQRNNALDEAAIAEGGRRDLMVAAMQIAKWWSEYAEGAAAQTRSAQ